jgi:hypothetical protein
MSWSDQEEIHDRLEKLGEYETISTFALVYYSLIAEFLFGESRASQGIRLRFAEFLEVVERYHRALETFATEEQVTLGNVRSAAEKRDIGLRVLLEQIAVDATDGEPEVGRLLLSAECYYQLAMVDRVVERLETAVSSGADHPLVHFALGYNRFELATHAFTRYNAEAGTREVDDEDRFRLACLSAVSAFQDGLRGEAFDGQLHWWIGNVLRAAGFEDAAEASFEKSQEIFDATDRLDIDEDAFGPGIDISAEYEYDLLREGGPITEDEIRRAGLLLRRSYSQSDLLGN